MGNYIATIMDRHYLGDTILAFSCSHAVVGTYDEEEDVFIDRNGNHYYKMGSYESLNSKIPHSFFNLMKLSELEECVENNISINTAIKQYEELCKERVHFVGVSEIGETFYTVLNLDTLHQLAIITTSDPDKEENENDNENADYEADVDDFILDIINGKFSLDQLKEMKDQLCDEFSEIESVIDALSLQIETLEDEENDMDYEEVLKERKKPERKMRLIKAEEEEKKVKEKAVPNQKINIEELFNKVTKTLIAQDEPTRRVITELARKELDARKKKEGILLTGPTGVGKTELMRLIAKYLDRPFHKINSTKLTTPGYVGKDVEEELWELYLKCGKDVKKAEQAIIFFDEIDKKGSRKRDDVSGQGVLNVLLPFIEGSTYDACADMRTSTEKVKIDTSNMIVILGGAYTDVYKNLLEKPGIGLTVDRPSEPHYRKATTKDFVDRGMMTDEFMGRVTVVKLNDLTVNDIKRVMLESDESAMKIQKEIFEKIGVKLTFTDGFATEVAKQAEKKKTGARGLNGIIDEATWKAFAEVHTHMGDYEEVILDEETVNDASHYQLVKKK